MNKETVPDPILINNLLNTFLEKGKSWILEDGNRLICVALIGEIGEYIRRKGETWRAGEGCEINDKYQALMELIK